ncbi:MAG: XRE family transcriptional regulator [Phycisphaerales bacterium]
MIGQRIRARRNELGLTLQQLADRVDCAKGYLSMIETGRRPAPSEEMLARLESALLLEAGQLVASARWASTPPEVRERVEAMEARDRRARALAKSLLEAGRDLDALLANGELRRLVEDQAANIDAPTPLRYSIPVINQVAAGYPRHFTDLDYPARVADEYIGCPDVADPQAFAARVVGDSMEPDYREGDLVVFSPDAATPDGADCFVRLEPDHETTFKRVYFEGADRGLIRLQPLNPTYGARLVRREQVAGVYAAVFVMRRVPNGGAAGGGASSAAGRSRDEHAK